MKRMLLYSVVALLLVSATHFACSNNEKAETDKGTIDEMTDKAAEEMADRIRVPLDKAREAKELVEKEYRDMKEAVEENEKE